MNFAPIVVFSYNRPNHLRRTLDALSKNLLASDSILYIYCDGPKLLRPSECSEETVVEKSAQKFFYGSLEEYEVYLQSIKDNISVARSQSWPKELHVIERKSNIGLAPSIVGAVTEIVNQYGHIITLEDDVITSPGFLCYMNKALEVYQGDDEVMHVSAYMYPHKGKLPETFFYPVPYPGGGWATWRRAWQLYCDDAEVLYNQWKDHWDKFDTFGGNYLSKQLIDNYNGKIRTWFVKWHAVMLNHHALTLYPHQSLTNNIGFDNQATNCKVTNKFDVIDLAKQITVERMPRVVNKKASRIIFDFYQGHWYNRRRRRVLLIKISRFLTFGK